MLCIIFYRRRPHPTGNRSSSFTLLQSLAAEDSSEKPTYSVLLGQLFAFIGTTPDHAVSMLFNIFTTLSCLSWNNSLFWICVLLLHGVFLHWTKLI